MTAKYLLKVHEFYENRIAALKAKVIHLKRALSEQDFVQHELVKFAFRLKKATEQIIPEDPDKPEYRLTGNLKKYRRYKQGLARYRLMFFFSNLPPIIVYLYINDEEHLRKDGDKNDPYAEFQRLVTRGIFTPNVNDPKAREWIRNLHE